MTAVGVHPSRETADENRAKPSARSGASPTMAKFAHSFFHFRNRQFLIGHIVEAVEIKSDFSRAPERI